MKMFLFCLAVFFLGMLSAGEKIYLYTHLKQQPIW